MPEANPLANGANLYLKGELVTNLVIPDTVSEIKGYSFCGCMSLVSVEIPDNVTSIGDSTFRYCDNLTSVVIGDSVQSIGDWTFYGCKNLTSITIPESVNFIGEKVFYDCENLMSVVIGDSVTSIGYKAFAYCDNLTSVYYKGTAEDWANISIGSSNSYLINATRYYYSETKPTMSGNYWHYDENGEIAVW